MRLLYRLVYREAFNDVQRNRHHSAPQLAGPKGLPVQWVAAFRSAIDSTGSTPQLDPTVCTPLIALLNRHAVLGGRTSEIARAAAADLLEQAEYIDHYFSRWEKRSCSGFVYSMRGI